MGLLWESDGPTLKSDGPAGTEMDTLELRCTKMTCFGPKWTCCSPKLTHLSPELACLSPEVACLSPELACLSPKLAHLQPKLDCLSPRLAYRRLIRDLFGAIKGTQDSNKPALGLFGQNFSLIAHLWAQTGLLEDCKFATQIK